MAGNGLPIYYKNSKLVTSQSTKKRWKEYYLLVCTVAGFVILIAGVLWFVPSVEEDKSYNRAYSSFTGPLPSGIVDDAEEVGVIARPDIPSSLPDEGNNVLKREIEGGPEIDPRQRKLEEDHQEPIPVPGRGRPNSIEGRVGVDQEERESERQALVDEPEEGHKRVADVEAVNKDEEHNAEEPQDEGVGREGGEEEGGQKEEEDPVTKQRREKIVEVCAYVIP